jgi:hypothetical protein
LSVSNATPITGGSSIQSEIAKSTIDDRSEDSAMTNLPLAPLGSQITAWTRKIGSTPIMSTKRGHGGLAWSQPLGEKVMRQPQDGASDSMRRMTMMGSALNTDVLNEPEDARITGGTRSLARRLLGLNVLSVYRKVPEKAAAKIRRPQVA